MGRSPYLVATWTDPVTGRHGFVAIDRLIRGLSGGGLRMRDGCTADEVGDLAAAMTLKEAIAYTPGFNYLPLGGAKGGIDFDPTDPEAEGVLRRYLEAMEPLIASCWATGEDLGVRQDDLDLIAAGLGWRSTVDAALRHVADGPDAGLERLRSGFAVTEREIGLAELVGGYGVASAALAALERLGVEVRESRAVIQGFGSMGGATARYLADAGVLVIAVADVDGLIVDEAGLPVERLLASRDPHGRIDRAEIGPGARQLDGESWSSVECEILVPAATSYAIDAERAQRIEARVVAEAANVATSAQAELVLAERGVRVVPDFIANLATNAWWWWTLFGDVEPSADAAFAQIDRTMGALVAEAFERSADRVPLRRAAESMAAERAEAAELAAAGRASGAAVAEPAI